MDTGDSPDENDGQEATQEGKFLLNNGEDTQEEHATTANPKSGSIQPTLVSFHQRKWKRLREHYDDQYLDLFRSTFDPDGDNYNLPATQLGAALWQSDEKSKLYQALCRKGRHNVESLAHAIGTKSVVEVRAYLDSLREQEIDRQRFEAQPKNISHAEIPAAVEVGSECEVLLDRAADALLAFQEQYDFAAGRHSDKLWLIDHAAAQELDQKADDAELAKSEESQDGDDEAASAISSRALTLFRLSTFLDLSERLFMNGRSDSPESWKDIAEPGQHPALLLESVTQLYDVVINFLRRLMQSCLFIAQSRSRALTRSDYRPQKAVKREDVLAALDVLGMKRDTKSYWIGLARRNGWNVVDDAHRRGIDSTAIIPYDEVEARLSRSSRSRSTSILPEPLTEDEIQSEEALESLGGSESADDLENSSDDADGSPVPEDDIRSPEQLEDNLMHNTQDEDDSSGSEQHANVQVSRQKRLRMLEDEQDEYLERMDQEARQQEESRLLSLLGAEEETNVKDEESDGIDTRPPQLRKSIEECMGWSINYEAEWEFHAKRRKLDAVSQS